jgi:threonine synthase
VTATTASASEPQPPGESLRCVLCEAPVAFGAHFLGCPACRAAGRDGPLDFRVPLEGAVRERFRAAVRAPVGHNIWRYGALLPAVPDPPTLDEGGTPLTLLRRASESLGIRLYVKNESVNPTWSFKDRFAAVAVGVARRLGGEKVFCASTGNFGEAVAAYAAVAGIRCLILCAPAASPLMRRVMRLHGAEVVTTPKEGRPELMRRLVTEWGWTPVIAGDPEPLGNPYGMVGYRTIGYEIAAQLGETPDSVLVPTGGGDLLYGVWRGFVDLHAAGLGGPPPRLVGCQSVAAAPLVRAVQAGLDTAAGAVAVPVVEEGASAAVSIVEGRVGVHALHAVRRSGGTAVALDEGQLVTAARALAREGIVPEMASAASVAGALDLHARGYFRPGAAVVCVVTGAGVKWPDALAGLADDGERVPEATPEALARAVAL